MLRLCLCRGGRLDPFDQATLTMGSPVPGVHAIELRVALMDDQHRTFNSRCEFRAGDDDCNFKDAVDFGVESGHLAVEPCEVLLRFR